MGNGAVNGIMPVECAERRFRNEHPCLSETWLPSGLRLGHLGLKSRQIRVERLKGADALRIRAAGGVSDTLMSPLWDSVKVSEGVTDELLRLVSATLLEPPSDIVSEFWPELWPGGRSDES